MKFQFASSGSNRIRLAGCKSFWGFPILKRHNLKCILFFRAHDNDIKCTSCWHRLGLLPLWAFQPGTGQEEEVRRQFGSERPVDRAAQSRGSSCSGNTGMEMEECKSGFVIFGRAQFHPPAEATEGPGWVGERSHTKRSLGYFKHSEYSQVLFCPGLQSRRKNSLRFSDGQTDRQTPTHTRILKPLSTHFTLHLRVPRAQIGVMFS